MTVIDTNALVLLIVGLMDKNLIQRHKRTSSYTKEDFNELSFLIKNPSLLIAPTNVWTEVDNLLNDFRGIHKSEYYLLLRNLIIKTTEEYLASQDIIENKSFQTIGVTDSILLDLSIKSGHLITSDYVLTNIARAKGIKVYNLQEQKMARQLNKK